MLSSKKLHDWMEHNLQEPFFQAEMHKVNLDRENNTGDNIGQVLAVTVVLVMPVIFIVAGIMQA